jgi:hypothetical protein
MKMYEEGSGTARVKPADCSSINSEKKQGVCQFYAKYCKIPDVTAMKAKWISR